jgi:hypothetical protein
MKQSSIFYHKYYFHPTNGFLWRAAAAQSRTLVLRPFSTSQSDKQVGSFPFTKLLSTVRHFNNGLSRLKSDFLISLYIRDANETRLHLDRKIRKESEARRHKFKKKSVEICPDLLVRRHRWLAKHQPQTTTRRFERHIVQTSKDLQTTLPTVLGFLIPVAGYSFLVLGVMFPRVLLSRQFHTEEQRREFSMDEYKVRRVCFEELSDMFWGTFMIKPPRLIRDSGRRLDSSDNCLTIKDVDAAGPVLDEYSMLRLYDLCHQLLPSGSSRTAFSNLPMSHLHSLSLACNLPSILPLPRSVSTTILQFIFPRSFLESRLTAIAEDIILDDAMLIEEGHLDDGCTNLTNDEVLHACLVRGLPVGRFAHAVSFETEDVFNTMRTLLTRHLNMMREVMTVRESFSFEGQKYLTGGVGILFRGKLVRDHALQLLVLHLPALRNGMKSKNM